MSNLIQQSTLDILQRLITAVETDQIKLPTLPEVALKIRSAVEKGDHSAAEIADLLAQDSGLSARLLQLSNSPLYRTRTEIDSLQMAVTRLGVRIVKDLVVMLAIKQAFTTTNTALINQFKDIWKTSVEVASVCRVLAKSHPNLNIEHAQLAGLIHNIGALPIIEYANKQTALVDDVENLKEIIKEIQAPLGNKILSFWNFPTSLIDVASQSNNFNREHSNPIDYVDLVQAAILYTQQTPETNPEIYSDIINLGIQIDRLALSEDMQSELEKTRISLLQL